MIRMPSHIIVIFSPIMRLEQCAGDEGHDTASMGGLVLLPPVILLNHADAKRARVDAMEQMQLTHKSGKLATHANAFSDLLLNVLGGADLKTAAVSAAKSTGGHDLPKLIAKVESAQLPDTAVIGQYFSSACYIDDSFPSMLYLATKYDTSPENGLIANTNCGGENCHKGAMLGALYGAAHGVNGFPKRWVDGLRDRDAIAQEIDAFLAVAFPSAAM
jgi:ADP-ribosylglycohydrolase